MPTLALRVGAYPPMWPGRPEMQTQHRYAGGPRTCRTDTTPRQPTAANSPTRSMRENLRPVKLRPEGKNPWCIHRTVAAGGADTRHRASLLWQQRFSPEKHGPQSSATQLGPGPKQEMHPHTSGRSCVEPAFPRLESTGAPGRFPDRHGRRKQPRQPSASAAVATSRGAWPGHPVVETDGNDRRV